MNELKLYRLPEVEQITGLKRAAIYAHIKEGTFPAPVRITGHAVAWRHADLQRWIENLPVGTGVSPRVRGAKK
jgi:prophage regulatory protein